MSGIAGLLLSLGYEVSGSDLSLSDTTGALESLGAKIHKGHSSDAVGDADVVVYSSAVKPDNPEIIAAKERGIPVIRRAEMLAELMRLKYGVAVAGAHGKTTTTSMVATVLSHGGLDPTAVIGGKLNSRGGSAWLGQGEYIVAEADESDGSFLRLTPTIAVVTNIDREHMDHYSDIEDIKETFLAFMNKVPFYGLTVMCLEDSYLPDLLPRIEKRVMTYGFSPQADLRAVDITHAEGTAEFEAVYRDETLGRVRIPMPGTHNILNALGAIGVGIALEVSFDMIAEGLSEFTGVQRRFQIKGEVGGILVVDDYAHHPSEIRAAIRAAKEGWNRKLHVVFQPHRYSRTLHLWKDFLTTFHEAETLVLMDIYPASEKPIEGVHSEGLCRDITERGHREATYIDDRSAIADHVLKIAKPGDMVITFGAGDVGKISDEIVTKLESSDGE